MSHQLDILFREAEADDASAVNFTFEGPSVNVWVHRRRGANGWFKKGLPAEPIADELTRRAGIGRVVETGTEFAGSIEVAGVPRALIVLTHERGWSAFLHVQLPTITAVDEHAALKDSILREASLRFEGYHVNDPFAVALFAALKPLDSMDAIRRFDLNEFAREQGYELGAAPPERPAPPMGGSAPMQVPFDEDAFTRAIGSLASACRDFAFVEREIAEARVESAAREVLGFVPNTDADRFWKDMTYKFATFSDDPRMTNARIIVGVLIDELERVQRNLSGTEYQDLGRRALTILRDAYRDIKRGIFRTGL